MRKSEAAFARAREYRKRHYQEHREQEDANTRNYRESHRESVRKKRRELYDRRKDHFRAIARKRYHSLSPEQKAHRRDRQYSQKLKGQYGITVAEYEAMVQRQGNCCAVCGKRPSYRLSVDHRHGRRQVRGLLCQRCNIFVGYLETGGAELTAKAVRYLETHGGVR